MAQPSAATLVLFGASGDLTQRKLLPALFQLFLAGKLPPEFRLIGYGRAEMDDASFRDMAKKSLENDAPDSDAGAFLTLLHYRHGDYDRDGLSGLAAALKNLPPPMYYLALPPVAAESVLTQMADGVLPTENARILTEKPFGTDMASAARWNQLLAKRFPEAHIHRIDHYLAKDTVRNLLVFRFANLLFEPLWNRHYVDHIQVSATETIGVENRGGYYDGIGVVRDMLQNHVLLLLAFATMEPPLAGDPESIRDRIGDVLKSIEPPKTDDCVFGQYRGYREAKGVDPHSETPTFAAVRLSIRNWRWFDVPIYILSGKCLSDRVSEVTFIFRQIPVCLLEDEACSRAIPNILSLRIHPQEGIRLTLGVKAPGFGDGVDPASLDFRYADLVANEGGGAHLFSGYERVLLEALAGRPGLSWRADAIESAWKVMEPLLSLRGGRTIYEPNTPGGLLAAPLLAKDGKHWYGAAY